MLIWFWFCNKILGQLFSEHDIPSPLPRRASAQYQKKSHTRPLICQLLATSSKAFPAKHTVVLNPEDSWQRHVVWIFKTADLYALPWWRLWANWGYADGMISLCSSVCITPKQHFLHTASNRLTQRSYNMCFLIQTWTLSAFPNVKGHFFFSTGDSLVESKPLLADYWKGALASHLQHIVVWESESNEGSSS